MFLFQQRVAIFPVPFRRVSSYLLMAGIVAVCCPAAAFEAASGKPVKIPAARAVADQAAAVAEATRVDLPLLKQADEVFLESPRKPAQVVKLSKPAELRELRKSLVAEETPPSGGLVAATLSFYREKQLLRRIWMYHDGEWGFERPGVKWTTGQSDDLAEFVKQRLK